MVYTVIRAKFVTPSQFRSSVKYIKLVHLQPSQKFVQLFQPLLGARAVAASPDLRRRRCSKVHPFGAPCSAYRLASGLDFPHVALKTFKCQRRGCSLNGRLFHFEFVRRTDRCALTDIGPRLCILNGLMDWPKIQLERPAAVGFYFYKAKKIENRQVVTRAVARCVSSSVRTFVVCFWVEWLESISVHHDIILILGFLR